MSTSNSDISLNGNKTAIISGNRKKVHTRLDNGEEMVEEYDIKTNILLIRKIRKKNSFGVQSDWIYEIGQDNIKEEAKFNSSTALLIENSSNPIFVREDTIHDFQWRIQNLPYPIETYQASVDDITYEIIIRTTNKKYFKRIAINDMKNMKLKLDPKLIRLSHQFNTLIINYSKPQDILTKELASRKELDSLQLNKQNDKESKDCKQQ